MQKNFTLSVLNIIQPFLFLKINYPKSFTLTALEKIPVGD